MPADAHVLTAYVSHSKPIGTGYSVDACSLGLLMQVMRDTLGLLMQVMRDFSNQLIQPSGDDFF